jgi:phosphate-selective porin
LPEATPVMIDIDLMGTPSERYTNNNVDVLDNQDKSQLIVDLRSEAKVAAVVWFITICFKVPASYNCHT